MQIANSRSRVVRGGRIPVPGGVLVHRPARGKGSYRRAREKQRWKNTWQREE